MWQISWKEFGQDSVFLDLGKFLAFAKSLQFTVNSHSMAAPPTRRDFPWGVKWLLGKQVDAAQRKKMYINR